MTEPHEGTTQSPDAGPRATAAKYRRLLAATMDALTAAGRLTWPADEDRVEHRVDWAEFVTQALAGAAANLGSTEQALAGRPTSREAEAIRGLLDERFQAVWLVWRV